MNLQESEKFCAAIENKCFKWPSIFSDKDIDAHYLTYKFNVALIFAKDDCGISYICVLQLHDLRSFCVFIPEFNIYFGWNSGWQSIAYGILIKHPNWIYEAAQKLLLLGDSGIIDWLSKPALPNGHIMFPEGEAHLGHYLWNEVSGLSILVNSVSSENLPTIWNLSNNGRTDFYGPLEWIFPEFEGKIDRTYSEYTELNSHFIQTGTQAFRISACYVNNEVRRRVTSALEKSPNARIARQTQRIIFGEKPVLLLGLREGKRFLTNTPEIYKAVISGLKEKIGDFGVIIDGLNSASGTMAKPFRVFFAGEELSDPFDLENRTAEDIRSFCSQINIPCISLVGTTMDMCMNFVSRANFFVAPWGGGFAKYKWVSNIPGYAHCSAHNLRLPFILSIYDSEIFTEGSSPLFYPSEELIIDIGDPGPVHVRSDVDYEAKEAIVDDILEKALIYMNI